MVAPNAAAAAPLLRLPLLFLLVGCVWTGGRSSSPLGQAHGFAIKDPPMPFKWPVVGTLPDFFARGGVDRLPQIYEEMYREFGDVYGTSPMGQDELVVCDPRVFDAVLRREGKYPIGASEEATTFVEYYRETNNTMGLKSVSRGPEWKEWRGAWEADMYAGWVSYLPIIAEAASEVSKVAGYEVTEQKNIAFVDFISRSSFDMFTAVMYGESPRTTNSRVADPDDVEFVRSSQAAFDLTGEMITNPFEKVFQTDTYKSFRVNMDKTYDMGREKSRQFVEGVKRRQREDGDDDSGGGECPVTAMKKNFPMLERLLNRGKMSVDDILSSSGGINMAGVDTTTYFLSWVFLNLASNPDVQTKLADELKTVLNGADVTTLAQMNSLPYLKACIRESHRLTPTAAASLKKLKEDVEVVVGDVAYRVPSGQRIMLNLRAYPMDPRYVEDPAAYRPERFLREAVEARRGTPSEVVDHPSFADPFGRGKRRCLGANIAVAEMTVLLARMIQDWEISLVDPEDAHKWRPKQKLMLKADPYPAMKLVPRG